MYCEILSYRASNGIYRDAEPYTKLLTEFGLTEKEAQLYVHLLKYGPKRVFAATMKVWSDCDRAKIAAYCFCGIRCRARADTKLSRSSYLLAD